ncbi:MAG: hypothetical protein U0T68_14600 [Ferruginibacter sp.]
MGNAYLWDPPTGLSNPYISSPFTTLQVDTRYTVKVTTAEGCIASDDILVKVFTNFDVFVPNCFTPNADGRNDVFKAFG